MRARSVVAALGYIVPFIAFGIVEVRVALAQPMAPLAPTASAPPVSALEPQSWNLATGFGYVPVIGGLGGPAVPLGAFVTLERRLAGPLLLMTRFSGTASWSNADVGGTRGASENEATSVLVQGAAGLKLSLGSRDVIEVSPFVLLDGAYGWSESDGFESRGRSIGGEVGIALDRDIVRGFGIRLSAVIGSVAHWWSQASWGAPPDVEPQIESSSRTTVALSFAPAAELRWSF